MGRLDCRCCLGGAVEAGVGNGRFIMGDDAVSVGCSGGLDGGGNCGWS